MRVIDGVAGVRLAGTGHAFPSDVGIGRALTNVEVYRRVLGPGADDELAQRGWDPDRAAAAWGVERREWVDADRLEPTTVIDLGARAVETAMADAGVGAEAVDFLVAATSTPDRVTSVMAASIGKRLGVTGGCIDVRAGGAGGLDAWTVATRLLSPACPTAVVVASEAASRFVGRHDPSTAALYGDGAGALVLRLDPGHEGGLVVAVTGRADAPGTPFTVPGSLPPRRADVEAGRFLFQRPDGPYLDAIAATWHAACTELGERLSTLRAEVDVFIPYAVTSTQVQAAAASLGVEAERTFDTLSSTGCLGCAGPLVSLDALRRRGGAEAGRLVASVAVAGGVTIGALAWRV